jgi:OFA family oxalate/formate antiporter-like MFS transporter
MVLVPLLCVPLRSRLSVSAYTLIGAAIGAGGIALSEFISSVYELYLYLGVMVGSGAGMIYLSLASHVVRLFPERKGLAAGLFTACFSFACFFQEDAPSGPVISHEGSLVLRGIFFFMALALVSRFLYEVPEGGREVNQTGQAPGASARREYSPRDLLSSSAYYVMIAIYICGTGSGLVLGAITYKSQIYASMTGGFSDPTVVAVILGLAIYLQSLGRLFWGWISDRVNRLNVLILVGLLAAAGAFILAFTNEIALALIHGITTEETILMTRNITIQGTEIIFVITLLFLPVCYGAYASLLPPLAEELFGARHFAVNYNLLFLSFPLAHLVVWPCLMPIMHSSWNSQAIFILPAFFYLASVLLILRLKQHLGAARPGAGAKSGHA